MKKEETLITLGSKIDHLTEICTTTFSRMFGRFDTLEEKVDDLESDMKVVKKDISEIKSDISGLQAHVLVTKRGIPKDKDKHLSVDI